MTQPLARDPVFGEVARALRPRARATTGRSVRWIDEVAWLEVTFRAEALELSDRRALEGMRALSFRHDGRATLACPRFALAAIQPRSDVIASLLAAYDNVARAAPPPRVMGIVNVTPDSFSDGGQHADADAAIAHALELARAGADIVDVGGESTRPGAQAVDAATELARVVPVVEGLARQLPTTLISVDTTKHTVARAALDAGATIVNDVSAGRFDAGMLPLVADRGATFVAMHMQGTPRDMQVDPRYDDVVSDVLEFLRERAAAALAAGIERGRIWLDPGLGFGKKLEHNLELLGSLAELRGLGLPIVLGPSRKSFIAALHAPAKSDTMRLGGTAASVALAVQAGVDILRVHDVAPMREAIAVARAIARGSAES
jgi:dihydropteroate synthase